MKKSDSTVPSSISPRKEGSVVTHHLEESFSSPTPVKTKEPSRIKSKEAPHTKSLEDLAELPQMYGALLESLEGMASSLRLLSLRKRTPNFQNISSQVEILTGRKFLLTHLAQMIYILPEAVQIDKVLVHDEKTKCMKPEIEIALLLDVVKDHNEVSIYVALGKLFSSRLRQFYTTHPEGRDVPEAALPVPFNQNSITIKTDSISEDLSSSCETEKILNLSHFPPSFERDFSQKAGAVELETTNISSPVNKEIIGEIEELKSPPGSSSIASMNEITPVKLLMRSDRVVVDTPGLSTPMRPISPTRSVLTCEDEDKMTGSHYGKQPTSSAKKALDFYGMGLGVQDSSSFSCKQSYICLSDFVILIHSVFQSVNFCPITKEELVQKVIMNNLEFDDHRVVEMQMEDLEKLVPDWFCKKLACSGDLLYSVNKVSDLDSVCEKVNVG